MLEKIADFVEKTINRVTVFFFMLIFTVMLSQIFFRYVLNSPLVWTEELCRYLFTWICFLGWTIALRRKSHISIVFFIEKLPHSFQKGITLVLQAVIFLFLIQLFRQGIAMTARSFNVPTITLFFSYAYVYLAAPLSAAIMLLYSILDCLELIRRKQV